MNTKKNSTMRVTRSCLILFLSLCLVLVLSACSSLPAGTINGTLVDRSGSPFRDINLTLFAVTGQNGDQFTLELVQYELPTDENGNFTFSDVESGKYIIIVVLGQEPKIDLATQVLRDDNGEMLIFELPQSRGVDLGQLTWGE